VFSHVMVGTNDMERARRFYDALFGNEAHVDDRGRLRYARNGAVFMVSKPINGEPATHANGGTIGFYFDSPEEIDAWHERALQAGGTSVEDPPGWRERPAGKLYLAYVRDPDANKLCGLHRPAK
jgi:catechol 2,3-dioxygenase-like lactoylglutathione lyase family enzyme